MAQRAGQNAEDRATRAHQKLDELTSAQRET